MQPPNEGHERPPQPPYYPPGPQYPQQPPYYPPPGQPPKKKRRRLPIFLLVGALLLCVIIGVAVATSPKPTSTTTTSATSTSAGNTATTVPTKGSTPASQQKWTTTHTFTGNGNKKTAIFSVPDDWKIVWKCDPASFSIGQYNVIVTVYNSDNTPSDVPINTICKTGNTGDSTEIHVSGSVYLDVASEGAWTVSVQELK